MPELDAKRQALNAKRGFTLIEVAFASMFALAIVFMFLSASASFTHLRRSNLQSIATKIAEKEMERLRNLPFDDPGLEIPNPPSPVPFTIDPADLSKLPSGSTASRTIVKWCNFTNLNPSSACNPTLKQVTTQVNWTEKGIPKSLKTATFISENGL